MTFSNWIKLLFENQFKISLSKLHKVIIITLIILLLTPISVIERVYMYFRLKNQRLDNPPVFILGHWRSGTSHLHNLFTIDDRLAYPNMVDGLFPNHMILGNWLLRLFLSLILPDKRPMDDMKLSIDVPAEHDWAISNLSLLTPYSGAYFPNHWERYQYLATFEGKPVEKKRYAKVLAYYLKKLQYKYPDRQLVLKSPMDTARVNILKEIFPNAKFVTITRNPYEVYLSTVKLHKKNKDIYPLQNDNRDLDDFVTQTYLEVYERYFDHISSIPKEDLIEIRYEYLTEDAIWTMREIYTHLNLPDLADFIPKLQDYLSSIKDYQTDEYVLTIQQKEEIYSSLSKYIDLWEYTVKTKN